MKNKNLCRGLYLIALTAILLITSLIIYNAGTIEFDPELLIQLASILTGLTVLIISYYSLKISNLQWKKI